MSKLQLTSVKVLNDLYDDFKTDCIVNDFLLQKLVNRSLHLYLNNPEYKQMILSYNTLAVSGSL